MTSIFLSHNFNDKPLVEPVAIELRKIFGQENVFYDAWSIKPGDSIIEKMNEGLTSPDFVLFFVTEKSLNSNMVKLEWQSALYQATNGKVQFIPIRVDGSAMPAIIMQKCYIDMFTHGVPSTIESIIKIVQGESNYTPQHENFSNITFSVSGDPAKKLKVTIKASHLQESNPKFMFLLRNHYENVFLWIEGAAAANTGPDQQRTIDGIGEVGSKICAPLTGTIRPNFPMIFTLEPKDGTGSVELLGVMHETSSNYFYTIPHSE
ncbi:MULTISPECIES: toll/interleukin-1 receptor domain-containing protein [unclassified Pseudomonas]|uniref:toll/interleukin-1 receptor domain-containing protein n=1 Tax=unclassified Pseudomonas TaxID=196821 RepID=UPI00249AF5EA|nr:MULTISPECIES: toll/interleukin-1 receptor domain-containing protein [unclassified Pseudomonas]